MLINSDYTNLRTLQAEVIQLLEKVCNLMLRAKTALGSNEIGTYESFQQGIAEEAGKLLQLKLMEQITLKNLSDALSISRGCLVLLNNDNLLQSSTVCQEAESL